jgi:hypothetical protein
VNVSRENGRTTKVNLPRVTNEMDFIEVDKSRWSSQKWVPNSFSSPGVGRNLTRPHVRGSWQIE